MKTLILSNILFIFLIACNTGIGTNPNKNNDLEVELPSKTTVEKHGKLSVKMELLSMKKTKRYS